MRTRKILITGAAACAVALSLGACSAHTRNNALGGAGIGAAGGAAVGALTGGVGVIEGAAVGAGIGAAAGAIKGCSEDNTC